MIRTIADDVYPGGSASLYAIVQKQLGRLEAKRYARRKRRRVPHRFEARIGRSELIGKRSRDVADALCAGSMSSLLTSMLEFGDYGQDDVDALEQLLRDLEHEREGRS